MSTSRPLTRSILIAMGEKNGFGMRMADPVDATFFGGLDAMIVTLGESCLMLTVDDAAVLVDKLTVGLDARTSTLRVVA